MGNQVEPTRARILALAKAARGSRTRLEVFGDESKVAFNTYANFESGNSWPRSSSLRQIELLLGWKAGAIDEALASGMEPGLIHQSHMRGEEPFIAPIAPLREYSDVELSQELMRRAAERERYGLAASEDLGGVGKDDVEP